MPYSLRVLLENLIRNFDNNTVDEDLIKKFIFNREKKFEIPFRPARVILQDFTGVPCVADLAAMRDLVNKMGGDISLINPNIPVDLIIDHSIQVDYLVNNAGFGTYGKFQDTDCYKTEKMLYLNICTLTNLTHLFVKKMIDQGSGRILNVSSTSAFQPMPYMAAYGASKSYVYYFSQALRENLKGTGVTVTTLCPGPTKTAFWDIASTEKSWLFKIMKPLPVEEVVRQVYLGLMKGKRLVIPGWRHKAMAFLARIDVLNISTKVTDWLQKERFD